MDLLVPVCGRPVFRVSTAFSKGARLRESQAEPGAATKTTDKNNKQ